MPPRLAAAASAKRPGLTKKPSAKLQDAGLQLAMEAAHMKSSGDLLKRTPRPGEAAPQAAPQKSAAAEPSPSATATPAAPVKKMPSKADLLQQEVDLQRAAVADLKKELLEKDDAYAELQKQLELKENEFATMERVLQRRVASLEAEVAKLKGSAHTPANLVQGRVPRVIAGFPASELAAGAWAVAAKVSRLPAQVDTLIGLLARGEAKIGAGETAALLRDTYVPGVPLPGPCPIVTSDSLRLADQSLVWGAKRSFPHYANETAAGVIVLAGDAQGFSIWAQSPQCRAEVADVPEGRVFALIDGAIVAVDSERSLAVATAEDGPGSIVWGTGDYYVGELQGGLQHGDGKWVTADGNNTYKGQWSDGRRHGFGTYTYASGNKYAGQYKQDKQEGEGTFMYADSGAIYEGQWANGMRHGFGKFTASNGQIAQGRFENHAFQGPAAGGHTDRTAEAAAASTLLSVAFHSSPAEAAPAGAPWRQSSAERLTAERLKMSSIED